MVFQCDKCGECCRSLKNSPIYTDLDRGDGICKYLTENNTCGIYENRPLVCRVDEGYEAFFKAVMSKEEYYMLNYNTCRKLKDRRIC